MSATGTCRQCGRADVIVRCPAGFAGRDFERCGHPPRFDVPIDACIADLVRTLNEGGTPTLQACCGHGRGDGEIMLVDGRTLTVRRGA